MNSLFNEGTIRNMTVKNRLVLPPMVCFGYAEENGFVSRKNIEHYERIAEGGTGLIIVEATAVSEMGRMRPGQLGIWSDEYIDGWKKLTESCKKLGAKIFLQLFHGGVRVPESISADPISSSDIVMGKAHAREMTLEEIEQVKQDFINAAVRAEKAGFHGVELHGAHSYLLTQFFSMKVNKRRDVYGGSLENRSRIATEILHGIRARVSADFIIGIRMGCNENGLEGSIEMAKLFEQSGMDFLHISTGFDDEQIKEAVPADFPYHWIVYGAKKVRESVQIPVIAVNSIKDGGQADQLLKETSIDFVAMGRAHLADPSLTKHLHEGEGLISCLGCKPCKWFRDGKDCPRKRD